MDVTVQDVPDALAMPIRGMKRRATGEYPTDRKKARRHESSVESDSGISEYASTEVHSDAEEDTIPQSSTQTSPTPLSSKASPRWPSDLKIHACTYDGCDKAFNRPAKLNQHIRSHTNDRPFVCPHLPCTKDFLRDSHLKHHIKSAHSDIRDFICEWEGCMKSFITSTRLKRHHAAHEGRQKFMCTECAQSFRKHGTLQAHITTVHEGKKRFICVQHDDEGMECGKGFDTVGKLKTHEGRMHAGKRFWCSICIPQEHAEVSGPDHIEQEPGFSTYAGLQQHINIEHPPTCAECGLQCSTPATLKSHVEIQHGALGLNERRTHACPEPGCGRGFTKKGNLEIHLRLVHGNMSFVCGEMDLSSLKNLGDWKGENACGQALSTKANLVEHIRTIHMGLDHSRKGKTKTKVGNSKGGTSKKKGASALTRLTGSGYGDETGRNIACILPDCNFRFLREYDLEIHLETNHGLPYHEVQDLMLERTSLIHSIGEDSYIHATAEDLEADRAFDAQFDPNFGFDAEMTLENEARQGGDFWLGRQLTDTVNGEDNWLNDEMEMDQLIAGEYRIDRADDGEDIAMLDPALR